MVCDPRGHIGQCKEVAQHDQGGFDALRLSPDCGNG